MVNHVLAGLLARIRRGHEAARRDKLDLELVRTCDRVEAPVLDLEDQEPLMRVKHQESRDVDLAGRPARCARRARSLRACRPVVPLAAARRRYRSAPHQVEG